MNFTNATVGMSFALFIIWMQRNKRWALFGGAISGKYDVEGSRGTLTPVRSSSSNSGSAGKFPNGDPKQPTSTSQM